jgi:hypothetical protein
MSETNTKRLVTLELRRATSGMGDIFMFAISSINVDDDEPEVYLLSRADLNHLRDQATDALMRRGNFAAPTDRVRCPDGVCGVGADWPNCGVGCICACHEGGVA